jgi:hypothetical protein
MELEHVCAWLRGSTKKTITCGGDLQGTMVGAWCTHTYRGVGVSSSGTAGARLAVQTLHHIHAAGRPSKTITEARSNNHDSKGEASVCVCPCVWRGGARHWWQKKSPLRTGCNPGPCEQGYHTPGAGPSVCGTRWQHLLSVQSTRRKEETRQASERPSRAQHTQSMWRGRGTEMRKQSRGQGRGAAGA